MDFGNITTNIIKNGLVFNMDAANRASTIPVSTVETSFNTINLSQSGSFSDNGIFDLNTITPSFAFGGIDDYTVLTNNFFSYPSLTTFTISLWFKSSQTSGGTLFGQQNTNNPSSTNGYIPVIYLKGDGKIRIEPFWTGNNGNCILSSSSLNDDNWHNVTTTFNSGINKLYIDGVYNTQQTGISLISYAGIYYYFIGAGKAASRGLGTYYFSGNISNFIFYNRALSANEVLHNYNALKGRFA